MNTSGNGLRIGLDIGSTTVKLLITDADCKNIMHSSYKRHNAKQLETARELILQAADMFPGTPFLIAMCGSGALNIARATGVYYIQEVVATAAAVKNLYPKARTVIELGGQDAKIVFFKDDTDKPVVSDMRMNGSCAGGTGAFIDEIAALLNVSTEKFEGLAARGKQMYDISGRCGVFAKTDIGPLIIQGVSHCDIALSAFHAIAKQTVGGLAQGLKMRPPIVFEGGPFTFNPTLIRVFAERLKLDKDETIIPPHPEIIIAQGAAIAIDEIFPQTDKKTFTLEQIAESLFNYNKTKQNSPAAKPFFITKEERDDFSRRHIPQLYETVIAKTDGKLRVYIGVDIGSTTSKVVFLDENEMLIDKFYANNNGRALDIIKEGLLFLYEKYRAFDVLGVGVTGYGEAQAAFALGADVRVVETVAHARACKKYTPNATFLLDIGGQDMKAIWLKDGVIVNIMLNEACSSGCGSFLENFAQSLNIPVGDIAETAFSSDSPAALGSRCTVFMTSTIVSELANGKAPQDIMAGLCRAMIENVFTKVIRVTNTDELGSLVTAQGGTFRNAAVLRALEEYIGHNVTLAPYPGEMGAIGAALLARDHIKERGYANKAGSSFIGHSALAGLSYTRETGGSCTMCENRCARMVTRFSTGVIWVTGNRCERGEYLDKKPNDKIKPVPDLFKLRNNLLFKDYEYSAVSPKKNITIGLPRLLEFWESAPFWAVFFRALGFDVMFSDKSSWQLYEKGLPFVASDTVCFPAKLAHGHIEELISQGADRIFMPYIMNMTSAGTDKKVKDTQVCPVIKGYPMVIRNQHAPEQNCNVIFDTPVFHWYTRRDKKRQVCGYAAQTLGVTRRQAQEAFSQADAALIKFKTEIKSLGAKTLANVRKAGSFAVLLAGRPYHTDPFILHDLSDLFTKQGIPVLTIDSLPGANDMSLRNTRGEITNAFHAQMIKAVIKAAQTPELELAQIVSFGCGHDAILTDEVIRIMDVCADKPPLILKLDEGAAAGSLKIRVQSFIETVKIRRKSSLKPPVALPDAYPAKFQKSDRINRTLLIPNLSEAVSKLIAAILHNEGYTVKSVPVGGAAQVAAGKRATHNDICFPAQVVIGELLHELRSGGYKNDTAAVCMLKLNCECRLAQYPALLRKALDGAGFHDVPIITNDFTDAKQLHPGLSPFGPGTMLKGVWMFLMLDILEELRRKIRPYEKIPGETDRTFNDCAENLYALAEKGLRKIKAGFNRAIAAFKDIAYDRSNVKPLVFVTGELLVAAHPGSNFHIEGYLENCGMETVFPRITDQVRKEFLTPIYTRRDFKVKLPRYPAALDKLFDYAQRDVEKIAAEHPLYEKAARPKDLYLEVKDVFPKTLNCGEGWLMAGEIAHFAKTGVRSFVILQPFGCLPNHICGRGVIKRIKEMFPQINILPLDLDPDTSYANIENRLQMLVMNS